VTTEDTNLLDRRYPTHPMVGVGVVVVRNGAVLLVKRGKHPGYGLWAIPGGRVELGERARDAAAREALEECGVVVDVGDVIWVDDAIIRDADGRIEFQYVLVDFVAKYIDGEPACSSDALDLKWVRPADATGLAMTSTMPALLVKVFGLIESGDLAD
jgi:8-oxo-dGTP diphosphatase